MPMGVTPALGARASRPHKATYLTSCFIFSPGIAIFIFYFGNAGVSPDMGAPDMGAQASPPAESSGRQSAHLYRAM